MGVPAVFNFAVGTTTAICSGQTTAGAGALTIDGALLDLPATMNGVRRAKMGGGFQRTVSLTSTGNISGVNFTIVGTDLRGTAVTETRAGPNNNTVETTAEYDVVTSVTVDGAVATATSVGSGTTGQSNWYKCNLYNKGGGIALYCDIAGTINYTIRDTGDDVDTDSTPTTVNHPTLASLTADNSSNYAIAPRAIQAVVNSSTVATGTLNFTIVPGG